MRKVSVIIPTFNEELNILPIIKRIGDVFKIYKDIDYEIIFVDNYSTDDTRKLIIEQNGIDDRIKGIFYTKNFGFNNSCFYGLLQGTGDCNILIFADMQDPPELINEFIKEWNNGYKIVVGVKNKSNENKFIYFIRTLYYKLTRLITNIDHIEHFTGFGLYDKSFIDVLKKINDPQPYLRGIVAEFGSNIKKIAYTQQKREHGVTSFNFFRLYDTAMLGITSYSKVIMRLATIFGFIMSFVCFILGIWTLIMKLINWNSFEIGLAGLSVGMFFLGSIILFFIGFMGEYILSINYRVMKRPIVIEECRIGFGDEVGRDEQCNC